MIEGVKTRAKKSEQCAGFFRVSYKRKTVQPFFTFRLKKIIPSSAENFFASPITQRAVNVALCVLIRNCSRLSYLLLHPKG